jgi:hypothetical protein
MVMFGVPEIAVKIWRARSIEMGQMFADINEKSYS